MKNNRLIDSDDFKNKMNEYEKENMEIVNEYNSENKFLSILQNKKIIVILMGIFISLTIVGLTKSFFNIVSTQPKEPPKPPPIENTTQITDGSTQTPSSTEAIPQKELDQIKQEFHPFDNSEEVSFQQTDKNAIMNNMYQQNPTVINPSPIPPQPQPSLIQSNIDKNTTNIDDKSQVVDNNEYMSLKGIAQKNGEYICYIKNGLVTKTYYNGDSLNGFTITNINSTTVTLVDSNGNISTINK